jgi:hypothetical protein
MTNREAHALKAIVDAWNAGEVEWFKRAYAVMEEGEKALAESRAAQPEQAQEAVAPIRPPMTRIAGVNPGVLERAAKRNPVSDLVMLNGLTEAETSATASVAGLMNEEPATEDLISALAQCRDAFPTPEPGSPLESQWMAAIACPSEVPEYVRQCVAGLTAAAPDCEHCNGTGEVFVHAEDCDDGLCALNGDEHSCAGRIEQCDCKASAAAPAVEGLAMQPRPVTNCVPGKVHCAKCGFTLVRTNLYVNSCTTGPGGEETEPCPNDGNPMLPVTWEQEAREAWKINEQLFDRAIAAEKALTTHREHPAAQQERQEVLRALEIAEAALADIGDADREPGDDLAWCEQRAAQALPDVRAALAAQAQKEKP